MTDLAAPDSAALAELTGWSGAWSFPTTAAPSDFQRRGAVGAGETRVARLTPEEYRARLRRTLAGRKLAPLVERWRAGVAVDVLAGELGVPADVLWEVLEPAVLATVEQQRGQPSRPVRRQPPVVNPAALAERPDTRPARRPKPEPVRAAEGVECVGPSCVYSCGSVCGRTIANTNGAPRVD